MRTLALLFVTTLIPGCVGEFDFNRARAKVSGDAAERADSRRSARSAPESKRERIEGADAQFPASAPSAELSRPASARLDDTKGASTLLKQHPVPILAEYDDGQWQFYCAVEEHHDDSDDPNQSHEKGHSAIKIGSYSGVNFWHAISDDEELILESSTAITQVTFVLYVESANDKMSPGTPRSPGTPGSPGALRSPGMPRSLGTLLPPGALLWKNTGAGEYPSRINPLVPNSESDEDEVVETYWGTHALLSILDTKTLGASNSSSWSSTLTLKDAFGLTSDDAVSIRRDVAHRHFAPLEYPSRAEDRRLIPKIIPNHGPIRVNLDEPKFIAADIHNPLSAFPPRRE